MKKSVVLRLKKNGVRVSCPWLDVLYNPREAKLKIGFVTAKSTGPAVKRNKVKRIIRNFWRVRFNSGEVLFILKDKASELLSEDWKQVLSAVIAQLNSKLVSLANKREK
ncbi:MAG: ribonuclease P protein component [Candidatus Omnitrophica bacterium]|nr:ribonuclease P protein component [Candidatus Omnitrophota bacterium]MCM8769531.1 ribonuclease P protein component [Candidatus Omnitrophota bacterium]